MSESELVARLRGAGSVFAEEEAALLLAEAADRQLRGEPNQLERLVERRIAGEPLEQVVGWAAFDGIRFVVEPGVFVPRHRSEFLVQRAAAMGAPGVVVLDLCCGVGALGLAVRVRLGDIELHATDLDPAAVRAARRNLGGLGVVTEGDLYESLPPSLRGRVDLLLANAPYVPTNELRHLPADAREHEHLLALDGGRDGLELHRRVIREAPVWLAPGGRLLIEVGAEQAQLAAALMTAAGLLTRIETHSDDDPDDDVTTLVIGTRAR